MSSGIRRRYVFRFRCRDFLVVLVRFRCNRLGLFLVFVFRFCWDGYGEGVSSLFDEHVRSFCFRF